MSESLKDGIWYPEMIMKDLVQAGLSSDLIGADITDVSGKRFFFDKIPFALVAWKKDECAILAFGKEFEEDNLEKLVIAFSKAMEYLPFVRYETFQHGEVFSVVEWAKQEEELKLIDIMALPASKNIMKIKEKYYNVL